MADGENGLTDKQLAFCREYPKDWNGAQAAIRAGYSEQTARAIACELLTKPYIRNEIDRYIRDVMAAEKEEIRARVIEELRAIGILVAPEGQPPHRPVDRLRALELLGKYGALFADVVEHKGTITYKVTPAAWPEDADADGDG